MIFSSKLANTFPFVSHAMHVGGSEGRTKRMGPTMSPVASAVTQLSSSVGVASSGSGFGFEERDWEVDGAFSNLDDTSTSTCLRFLDFLSPLKVRALIGILVVIMFWGCLFEV